MSCKITRYGAFAILVEFENKISIEVNQQVISLYQKLMDSKPQHIASLVPGYNSLVIKYWIAPVFKDEKSSLEKLLNDTHSSIPPIFKKIEIPVCYSSEMAMDLNEIGRIKGLTKEQVIKLHTAPEYHVYMLGFTPGFPYLGGLSDSLSMPRKKEPRLSIPKGSVAIANEQTGIYPSSSPGGWQIIGRTPINLFNPGLLPVVNIGDKINFYPISIEEFHEYSPTTSFVKKS